MKIEVNIQSFWRHARMTKGLKSIGDIIMNENGSFSVITPNGQKLSIYEAEKLLAKLEHKEPEIHIYTTED